jgi:hypothetical protein
MNEQLVPRLFTETDLFGIEMLPDGHKRLWVERDGQRLSDHQIEALLVASLRTWKPGDLRRHFQEMVELRARLAEEGLAAQDDDSEPRREGIYADDPLERVMALLQGAIEALEPLLELPGIDGATVEVVIADLNTAVADLLGPIQAWWRADR